jgi:hypothetical protein
MTPAEREISELAGSIYSAEPDESGNFRTVQAKGFQNAPNRTGNQKLHYIYPEELTGF